MAKNILERSTILRFKKNEIVILSLHFYFFRCSEEDSLTFYPMSNDKFGFRFKPFKFVGHEILYIHCDAIVCLASDVSKECDRSCDNAKGDNSDKKRRKRSALYRMSVSSQTLIINDRFDNSYGKFINIQVGTCEMCKLQG